MNIVEAASVLREHNKWRRSPSGLPDDAAPPMGDPSEIGIAIDVLCDQAQSMAGEIARLQEALFFWLPNVPALDGECGDRIAHDAALLAGYDGLIDDSAEQRGWIRLPERADSLLAFALTILACWPEGGIEGPELQDTAVTHGLLVPETRYAPCGEDGACSCAEYATADEFADGVTCYRRAEWLKAPAAADAPRLDVVTSAEADTRAP